MADRDERPPTEDLGARRRRTLLLAWLHVALALGFLAWFVWAQVHR
jgi:hypothetical protein